VGVLPSSTLTLLFPERPLTQISFPFFII
jgi:hypothetical protein